MPKVLMAPLLSWMLLVSCVLACPGPLAESFVFFETLPSLRKGANFTGKVRVLNIQRGSSPPFTIQVLASDTHPKLVGTEIIMDFRQTSCGPYLSEKNAYSDQELVTEGLVIGTLQEKTLTPMSHKMDQDRPE